MCQSGFSLEINTDSPIIGFSQFQESNNGVSILEPELSGVFNLYNINEFGQKQRSYEISTPLGTFWVPLFYERLGNYHLVNWRTAGIRSASGFFFLDSETMEIWGRRTDLGSFTPQRGFINNNNQLIISNSNIPTNNYSTISLTSYDINTRKSINNLSYRNKK